MNELIQKYKAANGEDEKYTDSFFFKQWKREAALIEALEASFSNKPSINYVITQRLAMQIESILKKGLSGGESILKEGLT